MQDIVGNRMYIQNGLMYKIKQEIVLKDLFCELACTLHCTYNVHTYICNLYNADSSQYLPQAIVQFYLDSGLCQHSCTIACDEAKIKQTEIAVTRDKKVLPVPVSLCLGTRSGANVPGQNLLSRVNLNFLKKMTRFPVLEHRFLL